MQARYPAQQTLSKRFFMEGLRQQHTLAAPTEVHGIGYWSGQEITVRLEPADIHHGIVFHRTDQPHAEPVPAMVAHRVEIPRRTALKVGPTSVEMIEHLMAALTGLQVDNCRVLIDGPELPGFDGSSLEYVEAIQSVGTQSQHAFQPLIRVRETLRVCHGESWIEARPASTLGPKVSRLSIKMQIDYGHSSPIGRQTFCETITTNTFQEELASARTFLLKEEAEWLRSQGLGLRTSAKDLLIFDEQGPMENTLRFPEECVRHKMLDLVGDLALCGCDISGHFIAHCSGHRLNAEMVQALLQEGQILGQVRRSA